MSDFEAAIAVILRNEGGLVDNKADPGGITNFGLTIGFMNQGDRCQRYFGHPAPTTPADIRGLSKQKAALIYQREIWEARGYDHLADTRVATKVADTGVNMGEQRGEMMAQQAANALGCDLKVDGHLGPRSITAINGLDPDEFLHEFCRLQRERYEQIVKTRPASRVFLTGWLRRAAWPF